MAEGASAAARPNPCGGISIPQRATGDVAGRSKYADDLRAGAQPDLSFDGFVVQVAGDVAEVSALTSANTVQADGLVSVATSHDTPKVPGLAWRTETVNQVQVTTRQSAHRLGAALDPQPRVSGNALGRPRQAAKEPSMVGVDKVVVQVRDQDAAKEFWTRQMGFRVVNDLPYGEERWLEVEPTDGGTKLVLELDRTVAARPHVPDQLPTSHVMFWCDDLERTHAELQDRGVAFPQPPVRQPFGWWSMFEDIEGNRYALGTRDS